MPDFSLKQFLLSFHLKFQLNDDTSTCSSSNCLAGQVVSDSQELGKIFDQKNNSLNFRVKIKNKHTERTPYFIWHLKKDTLFKGAQADSPALGTETELQSEAEDTDSGTKFMYISAWLSLIIMPWLRPLSPLWI